MLDGTNPYDEDEEKTMKQEFDDLQKMKEEMQELVNRLFATKHPYYCPHGRPIIVQMSLDELDGRFERH